MPNDDRRKSFRLELAPGQAAVKLASGLDLDLRDLSAGGGGLVMPSAWPSDGALPVLLSLDGQTPFRTELHVVRSAQAAESGSRRLGTRFGSLPRDAWQALARFYSREFHQLAADPNRLVAGSETVRVTNLAFILNLFGHASAARPLYVVDQGLRLPAQLRVEGLLFHEGQRVIRARFVGDPSRLVSGRTYTLIFSGAGAATVFEAACLRQRGSEALFEMPREVRQTGFRESPRLTLPEGEAAAVDFEHPRLPGDQLQGAVVDIAGRGLSFLVDPHNHALFPGDLVPALRIHTSEGLVEAAGIIRNLGRRELSGLVCCGLELTEFASRREVERWHRFVFRRMHPRLADGGGALVDSSWSVLEQSRYVDQWTPEAERRHIRDRFVATWSAPAPTVGHQLLLQLPASTPANALSPPAAAAEGGGLAAGSLVYPGTWMLHHLGVASREAGVDKQRSLTQACELISGILFRLRDLARMEHFVIYLERGKRWNDRLYGDFARRYFSGDKLSYTPLHLFRGSTEQPAMAPAARLVPADEASWARIADRLAQGASRLERGALALTPQAVALEGFSAECAAVGYERTRQGVVALGADGQPAAALVAETGDEGTNIFGLLNTCRIIGLSSQPVAPAIKLALVEAARCLYREAGKRAFLLFEPDDGDQVLLQSAGLASVSPGMRWLAHRSVIPAWAAYLEDLLRYQGTVAAMPTVEAVCA